VSSRTGRKSKRASGGDLGTSDDDNGGSVGSEADIPGVVVDAAPGDGATIQI